MNPEDSHQRDDTKPRLFLIRDLETCRDLAQRMARSVKESRTRLPLVLGLVGTLGVGKTQWTRFFAEALGAPSESISSPTYVLVQTYPSSPKIHHVDAYRIHDEDEFLELGIEELFDAAAITIVEWADRFPDCMPNDTVWMRFTLDEGNSEHRRVVIDDAQHPLPW